MKHRLAPCKDPYVAMKIHPAIQSTRPAETKGPESTPELRRAAKLTERTHERSAGSRVAILVDRAVGFGIARIFPVFVDQVDVDYPLVRNEAEARSLLVGLVES